MTDDHDGSGRDAADPARRRLLARLAGAAVAPAAIAGCTPPAPAALAAPQDLPGYYPPLLNGLRGSQPGSFEVAHALRDGLAPPPATSTGELYDLVVVGAGISGLTAALLYRERAPGARVLVLDNHDDFGGHARRNEFRIDGELLLMNGGTYSIESPRPYSAIADGVLRRLGIDAADLDKRIQDRNFYPSLGLVDGVFLDRETFGRDHLVRRAPDEPWARVLAGSPLPARAQAEIARLEETPTDYLRGQSVAQKIARLEHLSYRDFLGEVVRADPAVAAFYQQRPHGEWGVGIDAVSALEAFATGLPGREGLGLPAGAVGDLGPTAAGYAATGGSVDVHLPDGGATVARALVRALVPAALPAASLEDLVTQPADYAALDRPGSPVRLRLAATVVRAVNLADGDAGVRVEYLRHGRAHAVGARHCVLACWNAVIPYLCPELPAAQRAALHESVKTPLVEVSVAIRDWHSLARLGVAHVHCPGGYYSDLNLNECVSIGRYATPRSPDRPTLLRLERTPCRPGEPEHAQNRAGRAEILATPLERYEREARAQLARVLGPGGFDAARDILAITVNRWPHGYAPEYNPLWDPRLPEAERPHLRARVRHGAIAIANSDAAAFAFMDAAIEQAHRAVGELLGG
jgi:spermidine dehydrogenase